MKRTYQTIFASAVLLNICTSQAAITSISFGSTAITDPSGVGVVNDLTWESVTSNANDIDGSTIDVTWSHTNGWNTDATYVAGNGARELFRNRTDMQADLVVTFSEINYANYDIIVYYALNSAHEFDLTASGSGETIHINPTGQNNAAVDNYLNDEQSLGGTGMWARFTGLTGSNQTLSVSNRESNVGITGFQIVAVPEPSATALIGLGGLALIMRRRK
ncbi:PEP-CTERM sorting domain-containing protein [Rubritalea tangerina]|uniref:PEP-CTERM sorting domain-containing protein n=1 Tax=Rubritalea tangerina TaxID=430798 RepID=A0ABW4ZEP8_9BACT